MVTPLDIRETNRYLRKRQQEFRRAAEVVAGELAKLPQIQKVVLFGSVAMPLQKEIPRFREYRRKHIAMWHECADVDLAVWLSDLDHQKSLQRTRSCALNELLEAEEIGVAHHQVAIFLMDADRYLGRLCHFGQCPKDGKRDGLINRCGQKQFLQQHDGFVLQPDSLAPDKSVVLFDHVVHQDDTNAS
jgi:hypothetical protein